PTMTTDPRAAILSKPLCMSEPMPNAGQGNPTPPELGPGQWISEPHAYLSLEPEPTASTDAVVEMIRKTATGQPVLGFSAAKIAEGLGTDVTALLAANMSGRLKITITAVQPTRGGDRAARFVFALDGR